MAEVAMVREQLLLDPGRCIGCKSCAAACFLGHVECPGLFYEEVEASAAMPMVCRQCEEAPCVQACPNEAMYEDGSGIVRRSPMRCTGCRSCYLACPFGVIDDIAKHQVGKCDLCADRTSQGLRPRCVSVCPSGALVFAVPNKQIEDQGYLLLSGRMVSQK
jgi:Fe-S-cluster-containing dehydrogenase component